jgi:hypothetical protein
MLVAGLWNGSLAFLSMQEQKFVTSIKDHSSAVESVVLNRLNLITGSLDKSVKGSKLHV